MNKSTDLDLMLMAVVSVPVSKYDNQIDYLCELMKQYNLFKSKELQKNE